MKNNYKFLITILLIVFIVPQIAMAAWWNPMSWGMWNKIFNFKKMEQQKTRVKINEKITIQGIVITPLQITSDSRCPAGADCSWPGTVNLRAKLENKSNQQEVTLVLLTPYEFAGKSVTLNGVFPKRIANKEMKQDEYSFEFYVTDLKPSL